MKGALAFESSGLAPEYKGDREAEMNTAKTIQLRKATLEDVKQIQHIENILNFILPSTTPHKELP
mgnify:CR=1 FL=1